MKVPGLSGTAGERQAQLYQQLGSPMGAYSGSYDQNLYLWNQIQKGNYGSNIKQANNKTTRESGGGIIPEPTQRTAFSEILPYETLFNPTLMTAFAESQVMPEIQRQGLDATRNLNRGLASTGRYRSGIGQQAQQGLADEISRRGKEATQSFSDTIGGYTTDYYNRLYENYNKNPSAFVMPEVPSFEQFASSNPGLMNAYNTQVNIPTINQNPFSF